MRALRTLDTPPLADLVLALAFAVLAQGEIWIFAADDGYSGLVRLGAAVLTLIASSALAYRRERPVLAYFVNGFAVIATIVVGYPSDVYQWTNLIAIYSLGAYGAGWPRWAGLPLGVTGVLSYFARFPDEGDTGIAAFAAAMWVVAWLAGRMYGARIEETRLRTERDLSKRLAEANEQRLVLEEERNRIARELHDIVGHTVNVMVVHADAGRRELERNVEGAVQAFDTIARTGRDALSELDRVLAVLRRDEADQPLLPTPGLGDLEALAETFSDTGVQVKVSVSGDIERVPASVGLATYRIVQEALTNTLKHASATRGDVAIAVDSDRIDIVVTDNGSRQAEIEPGRGILGMRERVALHGGDLEIGPDEAGGTRIRGHMRWGATS
jgi:signal transduction histidine kinase